MSYHINGGCKLEGTFRAHGAKNAALPILAASLLCREAVLENCPELSDTQAAAAILQHLGCQTEISGATIHIRPSDGGSPDIPDALMTAMRSSIVFLGATLGRHGQVTFTAPGGCELGPRPIDYHIDALRKMGAQVQEERARLCCAAPDGLHGAEITLPRPSVGATENIVIAAATAKGRTVIRGAAREPEIDDLLEFLRKSGAMVAREIDGSITVDGVKQLEGCRHSVLPDRIEAGTYLCAAAATGGRVEACGVRPQDLMATLAHLDRAGCDVLLSGDSVRLYAPARLRGFGSITTRPFPGFPTDMQAIFTAVAAGALGETRMTETIFDGRFRHITELNKLGAEIVCNGATAVIPGGRLHGGTLCCTDLRGGAAMAVAALSAQGRSELHELRHIRRGYQDFAETLRSLGAEITEIQEKENQDDNSSQMQTV